MPKHDPNFARETKKYGTAIASREFILELIQNNKSAMTYGELLAECKITDDELKTLTDEITALRTKIING